MIGPTIPWTTMRGMSAMIDFGVVVALIPPMLLISTFSLIVGIVGVFRKILR